MKISITGIDGVGKSTILRQIIKTSTLADKATIIHYPKFDLVTTHPLAAVAATVEHLADEADQNKSIPLKSISLFLAMRLSGHLENEAYAVGRNIIVTERDSLIDSLAYGSLYSGVGNMCSGEIVTALAGDELENLLAWIRLDPAFAKLSDLEHFYVQLLDYFQTSPEVLLQKLMLSYKANLADYIIYLECDQETAVERIQTRLQQSGARQEFHEQSGALAHLQNAYNQIFDFMLAKFSATRILRFSTEKFSAEEVAAQVVSQLARVVDRGKMEFDDVSPNLR